jgi:hypothetical protein
MPAPIDRKRPRLLAVPLLGLTGVAIGVALCEIALRVAGYSALVFEKPDDVTGTSLRPYAAAWQSKEGHAYVAINSRGFRDVEWAPSKPEGVYRIAVLGDSFVEARQVAHQDTFCAVLQDRLNADPRSPGRRVEVMNFGVAGYGTAQEWLTLSRDVFALQPDQVLLAVFTGNDIADNSKALSHPLDTRPYYSLRGDELVADVSFRQSPAYRDRQGWPARVFYAVQDHSRLAQLLYTVRRGWGQPAAGGGEPESPFNQQGLPHGVYREPFNDAWDGAWRVTERLILEMARETRSHKAEFGVVTLSNPPQVSIDVAGRQAYERRLGVDDLFYPERRITALGQRAGFPVLNLAPSLQAYAIEHQALLHGFANTPPGMGHWNENGHRLAGEQIAAWLLKGR